ncbi:MAG: TRAM domain-containing protein, partial [Bacteroidota bacterium]
MGRRRRKPFVIEGLTLTGIADKGKSVGRDEEGRVVFVTDAAPGDVVDVLVYKKKKGFLLGTPQKIITYSEDRTEPFCEHFGKCGGCKWQHLSYEAQLKHKETVVRNAMQRIGKVEIEEVLPILPALDTTFYRNKMEFAFSNKRWLTREEITSDVSNKADVLGFHPQGAFDKVIDIKKCWLQPDPSNAIRNKVREIAIQQRLPFFDARANEGFLRHILVRTSSLG